MDFIVNDGRESVTLSCSAGKGTLTLCLPVKQRRLSVLDVTATVYAASIAALIDSGVLIVPGQAPEPIGAPAPAEPTPEPDPAPRRTYRRRSESSEE